MALGAWFSVINKNKKKTFEFGRKDGEVCAGLCIGMLWEGQAASDPGDSRKWGSRTSGKAVKFVL